MSAHTWILLFLVIVVTCETAVYSRVLPRTTTVGFGGGASVRVRRWRRGVADARLERCAELAAPWRESTEARPDDATPGLMRVRPFSPGAAHGSVFPGKALFSFVRRVYHCCQRKVHCRNVKGIQGRLRGEADLDFFLLKEISSLTVTRAELHLQLSNPHQALVQPVLPSLAKRNLPTRYSSSTRGNVTEMRVDLQFLIKGLQDVAGGTASSGLSLVNTRDGKSHTDSDVLGDGAAKAIDLGLVLDCGVSCRSDNVHILQAPFIALYYK